MRSENSKEKPLVLQGASASSEDGGLHLLQAGSVSSEDGGQDLLQAGSEEERTMQTKESILAIRAIKAIGAIMTTLEIMLTRASPLVVELVVDELEWTIKIKLLAI